MEAEMRFCGIDLHSNNSVVVVTDETDLILLKKRCKNDLGVIRGLLEPHRGELAGVVVESTYNWYWLVDGLKAAGYEVKLANTVAMRQYDGLKRSGDEDDAAHLAQLLRLGILPTGYIHPPQERALRDLARKRAQLVRSRTQHMLAVGNIVARERGGGLKRNEAKQLVEADIEALELAGDVALAAKTNVAVMATLNEQIRKVEARLLQQVKPRPEFALLGSIPGVGTVLAIAILLEAGPISRFASAGQFASYARCVDSARYSNGKKKGQGNRKNGNAYLAWSFVEAANYARRYCREARSFFERKRARTNVFVATKALAHKLARASYHMIKNQQRFDVKRCFP
jgi:transposase